MAPKVAKAIADLERFITTMDDAYAIPRAAGEFLHALILATRAKAAVEIGTGYGYSGLWIASALAENGGRLTTIDQDPRKTAAARSAFDSCDLLLHVDFRTGSALDVLPTLDGPIDFVLNDADKDHCIRYVELLIDKLGDRGVVMTDNTATHAGPLAGFLNWIRHRGDFCSASVPVGNGMELSVKRGPG
jgi:predicted O-methyltransferase YrrM